MSMAPQTPFAPVPSQVDFPAQERHILEFWRDGDLYRKSVDARPVERPFRFYDGPPFATGLPHYGHMLASITKDVVPRYWTMRGYRVERRWGWDCHGLPVENEVEQQLGLRSRRDILEYGVSQFNEVCRDLVLHYTAEWQKLIERLGRWVDWDNQYRTMDKARLEGGKKTRTVGMVKSTRYNVDHKRLNALLDPETRAGIVTENVSRYLRVS